MQLRLRNGTSCSPSPQGRTGPITLFCGFLTIQLRVIIRPPVQRKWFVCSAMNHHWLADLTACCLYLYNHFQPPLPPTPLKSSILLKRLFWTFAHTIYFKCNFVQFPVECLLVWCVAHCDCTLPHCDWSFSRLISSHLISEQCLLLLSPSCLGTLSYKHRKNSDCCPGRPERWIVTIPSSDQWFATIGNHWKTIVSNGRQSIKPLKNHCYQWF